MNFVVHNLNIYRDGSLPAIQQDIHSANLNILRCSYWSIQAWDHTNLSSPYWRLYWNRESGATVAWKGSTLALEPDRLILIAPHTPFRSRLGQGSKQIEKTNILKGAPAGDLLPRNRSGLVHHLFSHFTLGRPYDQIRPHVYEVSVDAAMRSLIERLTAALTADRHRLDHGPSFALHSLILFALEHVTEADWPERQMDERVLRTLGYIENHLSDRIQNEDLGQLAGMSPNAFTRLFRQKTGTTPLAHLNQRRIEQASILLHHTDHSIEEIAEQCGFTDRSYFTRVFQKQFAIGPAGYRKHRAS